MNIIPSSAEPRFHPLNPGLQSWIASIGKVVDPDRIRNIVESLPAPRNRFHSPQAMLAADDAILRLFITAGWQASRNPCVFSNVQGLRGQAYEARLRR